MLSFSLHLKKEVIFFSFFFIFLFSECTKENTVPLSEESASSTTTTPQRITIQTVLQTPLLRQRQMMT
jgi:hypothetical protein